MQALAPATKKTWSATPRLNMCNKEYGLWGCGDKKIFDFQRYPRYTSLRSAFEFRFYDKKYKRISAITPLRNIGLLALSQSIYLVNSQSGVVLRFDGGCLG